MPSLQTLKSDTPKKKVITRTKSVLSAFISGWSHALSFSTRASRFEFWSFVTVNMVVVFCFGIIRSTPELYPSQTMKWVYLGYTLLSIIPLFAIMARRLHDINKSALSLCFLLVLLGGLYSIKSIKLILILLVVFVIYFIYFFYLMCKSGNAADNDYGSAIHQEQKYKIKSMALIIAFVLLLPTMSAIYAGVYARSMMVLSSKLVQEVQVLGKKVKKAYPSSYNGLDLLTATQKGVVKVQDLVHRSTGKVLPNAFGGEVGFISTDWTFSILTTQVPIFVCLQLKKMDFGKKLKVYPLGNSGTCLCPNGCTMEWVFSK